MATKASGKRRPPGAGPGRRKSGAKSATPRKTAAPAHKKRTDPLPRVRKVCLALPGAEEKEAWGAPTFRVKKKMFASYANNHHGDGRIAIWCNATPADQDFLVRTHPKSCFVPPYVGPRGWVGVRVDGKPDWDFVADVVAAAYRLTAGKR